MPAKIQMLSFFSCVFLWVTLLLWLRLCPHGAEWSLLASCASDNAPLDILALELTGKSWLKNRNRLPMVMMFSYGAFRQPLNAYHAGRATEEQGPGLQRLVKMYQYCECVGSLAYLHYSATAHKLSVIYPDILGRLEKERRNNATPEALSFQEYISEQNTKGPNPCRRAFVS